MVILLITTLSVFPQQGTGTGPRVLHRREEPIVQVFSSSMITKFRPRCTATSSLMMFRIDLSTHLAVIPALLQVSQCQCLATTYCTTASLKRSSHEVKWPFLPRTSASTRKTQSIDNRRLLRGLPSSLGSEEWPRSTANWIRFPRPLRRSRNRLGGAVEGTKIVNGLLRRRRRLLVHLSPVARGARSLQESKLRLPRLLRILARPNSRPKVFVLLLADAVCMTTTTSHRPIPGPVADSLIPRNHPLRLRAAPSPALRFAGIARRMGNREYAQGTLVAIHLLRLSSIYSQMHTSLLCQFLLYYLR